MATVRYNHCWICRSHSAILFFCSCSTFPLHTHTHTHTISLMSQFKFKIRTLSDSVVAIVFPLSPLVVLLVFIDDQHRKFANIAHSFSQNGWKTIWIRLSVHKWPFECQISNTESEWSEWEKWREKKWQEQQQWLEIIFCTSHTNYSLEAIDDVGNLCVNIDCYRHFRCVCVLHGHAELVKIKLMVNRMRRATKNKNPFY